MGRRRIDHSVRPNTQQQAEITSKRTFLNQVGSLRPRRGHRGPPGYPQSKRKSGFGSQG